VADFIKTVYEILHMSKKISTERFLAIWLLGLIYAIRWW